MPSLSPAPSRQPDLECGPASQTTPPQQRRPISTTPGTVFLLPMSSQQPANSMSSSVCKQQTSLGCASRTLIPNGRKTHDALPGSHSLQRRLALGRAGWVRNPRSREKWKRGAAAKRGQIIRQPSAARNRILLRLTPAGLGPQGLLSHVEGGEAFFLAPAPIFHPVLVVKAGLCTAWTASAHGQDGPGNQKTGRRQRLVPLCH